jgi:hypothetical protein
MQRESNYFFKQIKIIRVTYTRRSSQVQRQCTTHDSSMSTYEGRITSLQYSHNARYTIASDRYRSLRMGIWKQTPRWRLHSHIRMKMDKARGSLRTFHCLRREFGSTKYVLLHAVTVTQFVFSEVLASWRNVGSILGYRFLCSLQWHLWWLTMLGNILLALSLG